VQSGTNISNSVKLSGGEYDRGLSGGASLANAVNATSNFAGGKPDTTARILDGTLSDGGSLQTSFLNTSSALNDEIRLSDVYRFQGTGTDIFVMQLSLSSVAEDSMLAYLDLSGNWVNAVDGNSGGTPTAFFAPTTRHRISISVTTE